MHIFLLIFTIFIFDNKKENEYIYTQLNKKGIETIEKYKKRFPFKEPSFLKIEIVDKFDKRVPEWASGIYFNKTILLKETSLENLIKTFSHEIAHSFLDEQINANKVPLWFEEGLAQIMAGEEEDFITSFILNLTGGAPLEDLENSFPSSIIGKRLAYAKSRAIVLKMIDKIGWDEFYVFLFNLGKGIPFGSAFFNSFGENLYSFEKNFKKDRFYKVIIYIGTGSLFFWFFLAILLVIAYYLRRKKNKNLVKSWEENDTDLPYF